MNRVKAFFIISVLVVGAMAKAQDSPPVTTNCWQIGLGLGELPIGGSFKPSITIGYHFSEKLYAGVIYQFKDEISKGKSSFNAKSSGLDDLVGSSETVSQRFLFQIRYSPIKKGPYLSGGSVFNGKDSEKMVFDDRPRLVAGEDYNGSIQIQQTRPAGWGFALGLGYQYDFRNGFSAGLEWTPAWGQYPNPSYLFSGSSALSAKAAAELKKKMDREFKNNITNMYKVFHIGLSYRF